MIINLLIYKSIVKCHGGLAQLARAPALQAGGHRFEPDILHQRQLIKSIKQFNIGV